MSDEQPIAVPVLVKIEHSKCPRCGAPGMERMTDGRDKCYNGCTYPSADVLLRMEPRPTVKQRPKRETPEEMHARFLKEQTAKADFLVRRELRSLRKHLRELCGAVAVGLDALDEEMKKPSTHERGRRIAQICNYLDQHKDGARRYGLHVKPKRRKPTTKEQ